MYIFYIVPIAYINPVEHVLSSFLPVTLISLPKIMTLHSGKISQISYYPQKLDPRNKHYCTVYSGHDHTKSVLGRVRKNIQ